jgi:hypothetical protein
MYFQKYDLMFFVGLVMTIGSLLLMSWSKEPITFTVQLGFVGGLGIGVLGIWFVIQNAKKLFRNPIQEAFEEERKRGLMK